jgi:excisionase family DNA binding protein
MTRNNLKKTETSSLLTVKDVAALDNCSEKTVRRAIDLGLLRAVRVGPGARLVRIDPAAHRAYRALLSA